MKTYYLVIGGLLISSELCAGTYSNYVNQAIEAAATENGVPVKLLQSVCWIESHHNPRALNINDGGSPSYGLCQLKLKTARWLGFKGKVHALYNPIINAQYAAKYLKHQYRRYGRDWVKAVSAYNGGRVILGNSRYVNKVFSHILR